ncbi:MAG: divalent-cation tolerance protein CutA [Methylococcales bacterium]|nr:divalent-cation tolerance protein CutA [Methylococcales bacterium]
MYQVILCTCPDAETADTLAAALIADRLAACVNILPGLKSVYEWQGAVETAQEHLLLIKTHQQQFAAVEAAIKKLHPYQLPEIIALAIDAASTDYLEWINSCLHID